MKSLTLAVVLLCIPGLSFAQLQGTGGPGTIGAGGNLIADQWAFFEQQQLLMMIVAQQQRLRMLNADHILYIQQLAEMQSRYATQASAYRMSTVAQTRALDPATRNTAMISMLRARGTEDGPTLIASLEAPQIQIEEFHNMAMLQTATAQASAPKQATKPVPADDIGNDPNALPSMMLRPTFGNPFVVEKPKPSVDPGIVSGGTEVKLKTDTHYATIYYTTNGWTPTTQSARYTGPITIHETTHLEIIAVGPNFIRSAVQQVDYEVPNSTKPVLETSVSIPADGVLRAGTPVRVVFGGKDIDSASANVGDEITLLLDEDMKVGDVVIAAKGSRVNAALTIADAGHSSAPGDLVFEIHSVDVGGKRVPLFGGETLEGIKGGKDAVIKPGMTAMAFVSVDTNIDAVKP
jgi:hypothetical protein